ncbi:MAG: hypothetical protein LBL24_06805 [Bacteroidales bacterium]|jgi:hypothetical protein|nr:hypothetical protein [Bacteroidales bacterium]
MFERDYMMRILQTFFQDMAKLLRDRQRLDDGQQLEALGDLYRNYLKNDRDDYFGMTAENLTDSFNGDPDRMYRAEILATLLYHDAALQKDEDSRNGLLEKSLALYKYLDALSRDFSPERKEIIGTIEGMLRLHQENRGGQSKIKKLGEAFS